MRDAATLVGIVVLTAAVLYHVTRRRRIRVDARAMPNATTDRLRVGRFLVSLTYTPRDTATVPHAAVGHLASTDQVVAALIVARDDDLADAKLALREWLGDPAGARTDAAAGALIVVTPLGLQWHASPETAVYFVRGGAVKQLGGSVGEAPRSILPLQSGDRVLVTIAPPPAGRAAAGQAAADIRVDVEERPLGFAIR